ncbi:TPR domain protein [Desulfosporosinus sp. I2]|uniref:tetratricopeptide repeat protein n=1 Tax=Desulfosporosinus sp. I2 TaxID=1617025 RepID=UPI00061F936D|nr:tetratricopeptide repeat protein [Desulfosporosinus sp. I2]KJR44159.1 TPR domain protein [Desulfosporosinus sp. I2]
MPSKQNEQKIKAIVITILLAIVLVGAGAYGYFSETPSSTPSAPPSSSSNNSDYHSIKNQVNLLNQKLSSNPNDISLQQDLGNAYYDLATIARKVAPNEAREDYIQAIKYYQNVLNTKQDINVLTDMATAAFYSGQNDLAEKSYKQALKESPDFTQAYFNYGVFLSTIKKDDSTAISVWQTALEKEPNGPNADRLKQLITQTKDKLASQQKTDNPSADNPSNKTP